MYSSSAIDPVPPYYCSTIPESSTTTTVFNHFEEKKPPLQQQQRNHQTWINMTLGDSCSVEQPPPPPIDFTRSMIAPQAIKQEQNMISSSSPGTPTAFQPPTQSHTPIPGIQPSHLFNPALMAAQLSVFNNPQLMAMVQAARTPLMQHPGVVAPPMMPNILQQLNALRNVQVSFLGFFSLGNNF